MTPLPPPLTPCVAWMLCRRAHSPTTPSCCTSSKTRAPLAGSLQHAGAPAPSSPSSANVDAAMPWGGPGHPAVPWPLGSAAAHAGAWSLVELQQCGANAEMPTAPSASGEAIYPAITGSQPPRPPSIIGSQLLCDLTATWCVALRDSTH